jgi:hypothetical protein
VADEHELRRTLTRVAATAHLVATELEDLLVLGYEQATTDAAKVSGGDVIDLHGHGDQRARTALDGIRRHAAPLLEQLDNAINLLHAAGPTDTTPRTRRQINRAELADALEAQERRKQRGEYTPTRIHPQPRIH